MGPLGPLGPMGPMGPLGHSELIPRPVSEPGSSRINSESFSGREVLALPYRRKDPTQAEFVLGTLSPTMISSVPEFD